MTNSLSQRVDYYAAHSAAEALDEQPAAHPIDRLIAWHRVNDASRAMADDDRVAAFRATDLAEVSP